MPNSVSYEASKPKKMNWWYDKIVEVMIACEGRMNLYEIADMMNVTPVWLSKVVNSDGFKEVFEARKDETFGTLADSVRERVERVANLSLEAIEERLTSERHKIGVGQLTKTASEALKALGYGGRTQGPAAPPQDPHAVSNEMLARAREVQRTLTVQKSSRLIEYVGRGDEVEVTAES